MLPASNRCRAMDAQEPLHGGITTVRVNANISALNAARNLSVSQAGLQKSLEKLSSGFRINRAADDAAGLAISEGLRSEIRGNTQAQRNAQDGISFIQTAEGALTEVHSMLQRMRELAVQASNTATSTGVSENAEYQALATEITNIGSSHQVRRQGRVLRYHPDLPGRRQRRPRPPASPPARWPPSPAMPPRRTSDRCAPPRLPSPPWTRPSRRCRRLVAPSVRRRTRSSTPLPTSAWPWRT